MLRTAQHIIVVGCGGIGSWLVTPLATFLMADKWPGQLTVIDGDKYEIKNQERQDFHHDHVSINKAEAKRIELSGKFPNLKVAAFQSYVGDENVGSVVVENSVIFVCVDNHPARARIDKRAMELEDCCVFSIGNEEFDGNATISLRRMGEQLTLPMSVRHPEILTTKTNDRSEGCEDLIEQGEIQLLATNFQAAACAFGHFTMMWNPPEPKVPKAKKKKKDEEPELARVCDVKKPLYPQEVYFDVKQGAMATVLTESRECCV